MQGPVCLSLGWHAVLQLVEKVSWHWTCSAQLGGRAPLLLLPQTPSPRKAQLSRGWGSGISMHHVSQLPSHRCSSHRCS